MHRNIHYLHLTKNFPSFYPLMLLLLSISHHLYGNNINSSIFVHAKLIYIMWQCFLGSITDYTSGHHKSKDNSKTKCRKSSWENTNFIAKIKHSNTCYSVLLWNHRPGYICEWNIDNNTHTLRLWLTWNHWCVITTTVGKIQEFCIKR